MRARTTSSSCYSATITITDSTGAKASVPWSFTILPLLDFAPAKGLPIGKVGRPYSVRIPVSGKDARTATIMTTGKIPPGLKLDATGRLTGTPRKPGTYRLKVIASSPSGATVSKLFQITVRT